MQIKRTALVAAVAVAASAPNASAGVATDRGTAATAASAADAAGHSSRFAEMAAHRDAISNRHWRQTGNAPVVTLVRDQGDGFDWSSAVLGGSVPLALVLIAAPVVRTRRKRVTALA